MFWFVETQTLDFLNLQPRSCFSKCQDKILDFLDFLPKSWTFCVFCQDFEFLGFQLKILAFSRFQLSFWICGMFCQDLGIMDL